MKKKLLSIALCLVMVLTMMPATALAAGWPDGTSTNTKIRFNYGTGDSDYVDVTLPTTNDYWAYGTNSTQTESNVRNTPGSGWTWAVQKHATDSKGVEYTMMLDNFNLDYDGTDDGFMFKNIDLNIVLFGDNTINATSGGTALSGDNGNLYIFGTGKLTATGKEQGIGVKGTSGGNISIDGSAEVIANGVAAELNSHGIFAAGSVTIISNAKVTATGGTATQYSYGIQAGGDITVSLNAVVTATGGTATSHSYGIKAGSGITIRNSTKVIATGGTSSGGNSYGIHTGSNSNITISLNAEVTATGGTATDEYRNSYGMYTDSSIIISGDTTVTAIGGSTGLDSNGMRASATVTISDSATVTATGGTASQSSYGISANGAIDISSDATIATNSEATATSHGHGGLNKIPSGSVTLYTLTVTSDGATGASGSGRYTAGATANIDAGTKANHTFNGWTSSDGGSFDSTSAAITTFTMPAATVTVTANWLAEGVTREEKPTVAINYTDEKLKDFVSGGNYTVNGNDVALTGTTLAIDSTWFGTTISIVKKGNGNSTVDSQAQSLIIPARPDAPIYATFQFYPPTVGGNDGVLYRVDSTMQYSTDGGVTYTNGTNSRIENIPDGTIFLIRYKAKANESKFASNTQGITVRSMTQDISYAVTTVNKTYGDDDFINPLTETTVNGAVTYTSDATSVATVDSSTGEVTIVGQGTATITARAAGTATHTEDTASYTLTVAKATITITAKSKSAYVGDTAPTLAPNDYIVTGLVKNDTLSQVPTSVSYASTPNMSQAGTVAIKVNQNAAAPAGDNYNSIIYVDGTLTISNRSSSGGGGTPTYSVINGTTKTENGALALSNSNATAGSTVKITPTADNGYEVDIVTVKDTNGKAVAVTKNADGTYSFKMPSGKVTVTATFKKIETKWKNNFSDVSEKNWFFEGVRYATENNLFMGTSETTFAPNADMTRQQIWMVMARMAGETPASMSEGKQWATKTGVSDGSNPTGAVTREQLITLLWRAAGSPKATKDMSGYTDFATVADYAKEAVRWSVEKGVVEGATATTVNPKGNATRAQVAVLVARYVQK